MEASEVIALSQKIYKAMRPYVQAQLAKDAANRYSLKEEWYLPILTKGTILPAGEYEDEIIHITSDGKANLIWYSPFESTADDPICDGASRFPDVFLGISLREGAIGHDVIYRKLEAIAKAFGVSLSFARKFADNVFKSINLAQNRGKMFVETVSTMTFWGVRLFGGIYHKRHLAAALLAASLALAGCSGCVSSGFDDDDDYIPPVYEKVGD
jgi:hypothetical protein